MGITEKKKTIRLFNLTDVGFYFNEFIFKQTTNLYVYTYIAS